MYEPMKVSNKLKQICIDRNMTLKDLSKKHGALYSTFKNKLVRNTMKFAEVEQLMDELDCDIVFVDRKTKKVY